jgi:hypothetical protein
MRTILRTHEGRIEMKRMVACSAFVLLAVGFLLCGAVANAMPSITSVVESSSSLFQVQLEAPRRSFTGEVGPLGGSGVLSLAIVGAGGVACVPAAGILDVEGQFAIGSVKIRVNPITGQEFVDIEFTYGGNFKSVQLQATVTCGSGEETQTATWRGEIVAGPPPPKKKD